MGLTWRQVGERNGAPLISQWPRIPLSQTAGWGRSLWNGGSRALVLGREEGPGRAQAYSVSSDLKRSRKGAGRSPGLVIQPSSEMTQQLAHSGTIAPGKAQTGSQAWS